jgi:hypothetical protein
VRVVEEEDVAQLRQAGAGGRDALPLRLRRDEERLAPGTAQQRLDLAFRVGRVAPDVDEPRAVKRAKLQRHGAK